MKHKFGTIVLFALFILTIIAIKHVGSPDASTTAHNKSNVVGRYVD
jgi:hypothetical protein